MKVELTRGPPPRLELWHSQTPPTRPAAPFTIPVRLDFDSHAAGFARALAHLDQAATKELDRVDFDSRLRELVRIRASQLNGCAYCIDMHTKDARAVGESEQRLYGALRLAGHALLLRTGAGRARVHRGRHPDGQRPRPRRGVRGRRGPLQPDEVAALLALITTINAWNAIGVSARAWEPGSYQP